MSELPIQISLLPNPPIIIQSAVMSHTPPPLSLSETVGRCSQAIHFASMLLERNLDTTPERTLACVSLKEAQVYIHTISDLIKKRDVSFGEGQQLHSYE
jgi:hypothetical protein